MRFQSIATVMVSALAFVANAAPAAEIKERSLLSEVGLTVPPVYTVDVTNGVVNVLDSVNRIVGTVAYNNQALQILDKTNTIVGTLSNGVLVTLITNAAGVVIGTILKSPTDILKLLPAAPAVALPGAPATGSASGSIHI